MTQTSGSRGREIVDRRPAGPDHQVVTVLGPAGDQRAYRRQPCGGCPWRVDQTGQFPAEAFGHSAATAYDLSERTFACHESGAERSSICAGFLLRGADHNLAVRIAAIRGRIRLDEVSDGGHELYEDYRTMAVANGLHPDDPRLRPTR